MIFRPICRFHRQSVPMLTAAAATALLALPGCSAFRHREPPPPPAAPVVDNSPAPTAGPQTVTEAYSGDAEDAGTTTVLSNAGPALNASAPQNYLVKRGDTLWGIANMFLRDPWLWPEIWYANPQINNPHRIYPGDTVRLARGRDGSTVIQVVRGQASAAARLRPMLRDEAVDGSIATIPYNTIASFLSHPGVMEKNEIKRSPYVVAFRDWHIIAGTGHELYVRRLTGEAGARYNVMHIDAPLLDPEHHRSDLGYLAVYTGTARLDRPGDIAKATLTDSARETLVGDILVEEDTGSTSDFIPHVPTHPIDGSVIAVINNVLLAGQYDVIALNRGSRDGLERGHILSAETHSETVPDPCVHIQSSSTCTWHATVQLPAESSGTLLVFKVYERMSYALIMKENSPIQVGDHFRQR